LVFGLALSIGAISLFTQSPTTVAALTSDIIAFGFSFLILISVWIRYTAIMTALPIETTGSVVLNVVLLFFVSIEPYLLNQVGLYGHTANLNLLDYSTSFYALDMGGMMFILGLLTHELSVEEKKLIPPRSVSKCKRLRNYFHFWAALFFLTIIPQFWSLKVLDIPLRFYFWVVPLFASLAVRARGLLQKDIGDQDSCPPPNP
jgi:uncharacterized membrane protein